MAKLTPFFYPKLAIGLVIGSTRYLKIQVLKLIGCSPKFRGGILYSYMGA